MAPPFSNTSQTSIASQLEATDQQVLTDVQLLALIARGENWALSEICARYTWLVFSLALKILNDRASAEEIGASEDDSGGREENRQ